MNHRQLSADIKIKNFKFNISYVGPEMLKGRDNKTGIYFKIFHDFSVWLMVLIQRILIGFNALLEKVFYTSAFIYVIVR